MNIHIYDTHVHTDSGEYVHFDVLVNDENINNVKQYAESYLASLGISIDNISQSRCDFCHSEIANPEVQLNILEQGYSIIQL
ncbi:DUF2024 family protein [Psychromonas sp. SR45-3]|uniref:DUF2024 family protein n=1 Tax=Psychromonas sp. SR45-3 TaxID=2760930 RepID=UPI0015FE5AF1|nr:DUF2024 family protein [Psychromonas sp. SR45-3]MBB1272211.1 DUF2024 family protein [Psychromonas sp. SR45-3]